MFSVTSLTFVSLHHYCYILPPWFHGCLYLSGLSHLVLENKDHTHLCSVFVCMDVCAYACVCGEVGHLTPDKVMHPLLDVFFWPLCVHFFFRCFLLFLHISFLLLSVLLLLGLDPFGLVKVGRVIRLTVYTKVWHVALQLSILVYSTKMLSDARNIVIFPWLKHSGRRVWHDICSGISEVNTALNYVIFAFVLCHVYWLTHEYLYQIIFAATLRLGKPLPFPSMMCRGERWVA